MNIQYHYWLTFALAVEALSQEFRDKEELFDVAFEIATSNEMIDVLKPKFFFAAKEFPPYNMATQVDPKDKVTAVMLASGDHVYPLMVQGHKWHFDPNNGWPKLEWYEKGFFEDSIENRMLFGAHLHSAQDTDGPHKGYVGIPHENNLKLSKERRAERKQKLPWYSRFAKWVGWGDEAAWGHTSDIEADEIENCRVGAYSSALKLFNVLWGKTLRMPNMVGSRWVITTGPFGNVKTLYAISYCHNDEDLKQQCQRIVKEITGKEIPDFKPYTGEKLKLFLDTIQPELKKGEEDGCE